MVHQIIRETITRDETMLKYRRYPSNDSFIMLHGNVDRVFRKQSSTGRDCSLVQVRRKTPRHDLPLRASS